MQKIKASVPAAHRLNGCSSQALEHRLSSCDPWGLVALQHVGFSQTRDQTRVPQVGSRFLSTAPPEKSSFCLSWFELTLTMTLQMGIPEDPVSGCDCLVTVDSYGCNFHAEAFYILWFI